MNITRPKIAKKTKKTMKTSYTKDKNYRLSFRVNERMYDWVAQRADKLGVSPCDFARSVVFGQMSAEETLKAIDTPNAGIAKGKTDANIKKHK